MEEVARGSRERSQLRTHAGPGDEHIPEALGMAAGQTDRPATRIVLKHYGVYGQLGREDGLPCGQAFSGIKDSVHGHLTAALLAEIQDVLGFSSFENSETEFRCSRSIPQGGVEAPVLWRRVAQYVLWKAEEKWRAKGWGLPFGGQHDDEHLLRGMMWAGNYWLISDNRERDGSAL